MTEPVIIIGGGPAGTASALKLLQMGMQPVIIEQDDFPRFHIGESLTTECTDALYRLGLKQELLKFAAPQKNGVRIFAAHPQNSFYVGAGDAWQVERSRFDKMLLDTAIQRGATLLQGQAVKLQQSDHDWQLRIKLNSGSFTDRQSRFVVDASGQNRFSYRQGLIAPLEQGEYARQIAIFSHYKNVTRKHKDNFDTLIFHRNKHEWCWMIPITEEITSIGVVVPTEIYKQEKASLENFIENRLLNFSAPFTIRCHTANRIAPVRTVSNYSYKIDRYALNGLYCVGDSHRFIDPIFSFGVEFAVLEAEYMGKAMAKCVNTDRSQWHGPEQEYMQITTAAQNIVNDMLSYFWAHPWGFTNMAHSRHKDEFLEIFAGRIYEVEAGQGLTKMRKAMA